MSDNKSDNKKDQEYEIAEQVFTVGKKSDEVSKKPKESRYSRAELLANAQAIFGVMPEVVTGALHGNNSEELTISEVKKAIKQFLKRSVS